MKKKLFTLLTLLLCVCSGAWAEMVELENTEVESLDMLEAGEFDAYITLNAYGDPNRLVPVCKIGSSDFYFAVNKDRPDLLDDLNMALSKIYSSFL